MPCLSKEEGRQKISKYTLCIIHVSDAKHCGEKKKKSPGKRWWMMQVRASEWDRVGWEDLSALATWPQTWVRWGSKPWVHLGKGKTTCTVLKERQVRGEGWAMESEKKPGRMTQGLSGGWKDSGSDYEWGSMPPKVFNDLVYVSEGYSWVLCL